MNSQVPISSVAKVFNGKTPSKTQKRSTGHPVLKIRDVSEQGEFLGIFDSFVDNDFATKYEEKQIRLGDILILNAAHSAHYVGSKVYLVEETVVGSIATGEWLIIRPDRNTLDSKYLFFWLIDQKTRDILRQLVKGIHLYPRDVGRLKVSVLPLPEQRRIAAILDKAHTIRRKRQDAIRLMDEFLRSAFLEMFGNLFKNSRNWQLIEFGKVILLLTDYHANGSYKLLRNNVTLLNKPDYALMVRTTDLENDNFKDGVKYISRSAYEFLGKTKVFGGEIIINKIGSAGKVYLMPKLNRKISLGMNQFMIRLTESANNIFIYYLLRSEYGEAIIQNKVQGAVTKTITKDAIRGLIIPLPPIEIQNRFARIVEWIDSIKRKMHTSMREMKTQFDSLVQHAFRGELLPTEAELARHGGRSYEPASALLAKIKAQRKDIKPQRKRGRALQRRNNISVLTS